MKPRFVLTDYVERAMAKATYKQLGDGSYAGRIPPCKGVIAFGSSLEDCERELRSTLEEWILLGLQLGHKLPVVAGIDLNKRPEREPVESL
ncbi:MAG: type II toxin-antitoxin system HicB family antitoxin [Dehalococcoidia bacterium]|nr:type II toxin-antitoxin system HicB family antitoxin [Dehalococcoidia bacterium]